MPAAVHQLAFPLRDARWRPVLDLNGAQAALDLDGLEVSELIENRDLVAWNIAIDVCAGSGTREDPNPQRCLRILTGSVAHYRATLGSRQFRMEWPEILQLMIGHNKPVMMGTEIRRSLNCDEHHLHQLLPELALVPGTDYGRGRGRTPSITRGSFEAFLKRRLL